MKGEVNFPVRATVGTMPEIYPIDRTIVRSNTSYADLKAIYSCLGRSREHLGSFR